MGVSGSGERGFAALRPDELARAVAALRQPGSNLVIVGEPGSGKFVLAQQAAAALAAELGPGSAPHVITLCANETMRAIPFALMSHGLPGGGPESFADQATAYASVVRRLPSDAGGTLILVDHAGNADEDSLLLLLALGARPDVRLVVTVRDAPGLPRPVMELLHAGAAERLELGSLAPEQSTVLAMHLLGASTIEAETAARLHRVSGGNVLFLAELIGGLTRAGALTRHGGLVAWSGDDIDIPGTLTGFLARELAQARPETRSAIITIALAEPISLMTVGKLRDIIDPDALDRLAGHQFVRYGVAPDGSQFLTCANQLIGEVARSAAPPGQRLRLLSRLAEVLAPELQTLPPQALLRSIGIMLDAGVTPDTRSLKRALEFSRSTGSLRLTTRLGAIVATNDDFPLAERLAAAAARTSAVRSLGSPEQLADPELLQLPEGATAADATLPFPGDDAATLLARVELALARADILLYRDDGVATALALIGRVRDRLLAGESPARRALLVGEFIRLGYAGRFPDARALLARAPELSGASELAAVAGTQTLIAGQEGESKRARARAWEAIPLALRRGSLDPTLAGEIIGALFFAELLNGRVGAARGVTTRLMRELAKQPTGYRAGSGLLGIASGLLALAEGRWSDAGAEFDAAARTLERSDGTGFRPIALSGSALALAASGKTGAARQTLDELAATPLRASRIVEGVIRLHAISAELWLGDTDGRAHV